MKKPNVLNRSMFNRGGTSAYGKGITSNLVSDEQRQRFNYGGRVGLRIGGGPKIRPISILGIDPNQIYPDDGIFPPVGKGRPYYDYEDLSYEEIPSKISTMPYNVEGISELPYKIGQVTGQPSTTHQREPVKKGNIYASGYVGQGREDLDLGDDIQESVDISNMSLEEAREIGRENDWWRMEKGDVWVEEDLERAQKDLTDEEKLIAVRAHEAGATDTPNTLENKILNQTNEELLTGNTTGAAPGIGDTDMLDIEGIINKYYDKKTALGEGQLGLAGSVLAAGFEGDKKKAAAILGGGMGTFGKTLAADKKVMQKLGATGEIQREIYRQSRAAEGVQDRLTADYKAKLKAEGADTEDLSNLEKYMKLSAWDTDKLGPLTGDKHKDFIATIDPVMAEKVTVMEQHTTGVGKDKKTQFSQFAVDAYKDAAEGDPIVIGDGKLYIKDSSAPAVGTTPQGMREVGFWDYQKSLGKKKKKLNKGQKILETAGVSFS